MRTTIVTLLFLFTARSVLTQDVAQGKVEPRVFDDKTDAKSELQMALARAKKNNRRVLIHWGEESSEWCAILHKAFNTDAKLRRQRLYEFEWINVAVNKTNTDLATQHKATVVEGVPYLTILDAEGKPLANQRAEPFQIKNDAGEKKIDAAKLIEFLSKHEAKPLVAAKVLQDGLDQAAKNDRLVFLHFGAPWCGWCHRLEDWMEQKEIAPILGKEFVDVLIDIDRMEGGKDILARYNTSGKGGIPWFAFVDSKGKALATSDSAKGNIGHPYADHEIEHFVKMLSTTKRHLSQTDIERIDQSLKAQKKLGK
jgi:thioredoxin-related protein